MGRVTSIASPHVAHAAEACRVPPQSGVTSAMALAASAPNGQSSGSSTAAAGTIGERRHQRRHAPPLRQRRRGRPHVQPALVVDRRAGGCHRVPVARQGSVNEGSLGSTTA